MTEHSLLRIAVLDDWQSVASDVVDWTVLDSIADVSFLHEFPADTATMVSRLESFEIICVMRERTQFNDALLSQLPRLKLLVTGGMRNAAIDLPAAARLGIQVCGTESYKNAAPEVTWALIMGITRNLVGEATLCVMAAGRSVWAVTCMARRWGFWAWAVSASGLPNTLKRLACGSSPGVKTSPPNVLQKSV